MIIQNRPQFNWRILIEFTENIQSASEWFIKKESPYRNDMG